MKLKNSDNMASISMHRISIVSLHFIKHVSIIICSWENICSIVLPISIVKTMKDGHRYMLLHIGINKNVRKFLVDENADLDAKNEEIDWKGNDSKVRDCSF